MTAAATMLEPFRKTVTTAKGTVSYIDVGDGPIALFVHGLGTSAYLWRNILRNLAGTERRCIAIDLPLHGRSPLAEQQPVGVAAFAELVEAVCAEAGLAEVDLVANDTGGAVAQIFAARYPERIRTLALTNCETHDNVPPAALRPAMLMARLGLVHLVAPRVLRNPERARRVFFGSGYEDVESLPLPIAERFLEPLLGDRDRARQFERWLTALRAEELLAAEPALAQLHAPVLVVWGTGDRFFDVRWGRWLTDLLPNVVSYVEVANGRLFFPDERAEALVPHLAKRWACARHRAEHDAGADLADLPRAEDHDHPGVGQRRLDGQTRMASDERHASRQATVSDKSTTPEPPIHRGDPRQSAAIAAISGHTSA